VGARKKGTVRHRQKAKLVSSKKIPIPEALRKAGIRRATDNLRDRKLVLPPHSFTIFFKDELTRAIESVQLAKELQSETKKKAHQKNINGTRTKKKRNNPKK